MAKDTEFYFDRECKRAYDSYLKEVVVCGITCTLPDKPANYKTIINYGLPKDKRIFPKPNPEVVKSINNKIVNGLDHTITEEEAVFIGQEAERRISGLFFYNGEKLEYVTGTHYLYLAHWYMPIVDNKTRRLKLNNPLFLDSDRDDFYFWSEAVKDRYSLGVIQASRRRAGKTEKGLIKGYDIITQSEEAQMGIQSKNDEDAEKVFSRFIKAWRVMFEPFKPTDSGVSIPKKSIHFDEPSIRNTKGIKKRSKKVLRSFVDYGANTEGHYDGKQLVYYLGDEEGKNFKIDVSEKWNTVKECLVVGSYVIGKALLTTTVEEMERKGGKNFKKIWDVSDIAAQKSRGFKNTTSGLWKMFIPADMGFIGDDDEVGEDGKVVTFVDQWGYSNREAARAYIMRMRERKKAESIDNYLSFVRKYPLEESDLWIQEAKGNPLNLVRINQQIRFNENILYQKPERGNFYWVVPFRQVGWASDEYNGRWLRSGDMDKPNQVYLANNQLHPNNRKVIMGIDPVDHAMTSDKRKSNSTMYAFHKADIMNPQYSNTFLCEYVNRRDDPYEFYEDAAMMAIFFGSQVLVENQKIGLVNWFRDKGLNAFLMDRPSHTHTKWSKEHLGDKGMPTNSVSVRSEMINVTIGYINQYVGKNELTGTFGNMPFNSLLQCWANFTPEDWTKHDEFVAAALCLLAAEAREVAPTFIEMGGFI